MPDLHEACAAAGIDSSRYRPIAHATDSNRVAVYIGASYAHLTRGQAINLRDQITRALQHLAAHSLPVERDESPAPFAEQLGQFRAQLTDAGRAAWADAEAAAMAELAKEAQS